MKNKKMKKYNIEEFYENIIELLEFENNILKKKINNEELNDKEKFFDTYIISPSFVLRHLKGIKK